MNKKEKKIFIRMLINSVKDEVIANVDIMPDGWDGIELREYLSYKFACNVHHNFSGQRKIDYDNALRNINL